MKYEIKGGQLPVVECFLEKGESMNCENGARSWMSPNMQMETSGGGLGKLFSKAATGESLFHNTFTAVDGSGYIAFASSFPGSIVAVEIKPGQEIVCQKSAYLASTKGVELSIFFQKKLGAGLFGGEGFIMQKLSGQGTVFLEVDGSVVTKQLAAGEQIIMDPGYLAMMDASCTMDIQALKGFKNILLSNETLFNTVVTGPGKVCLQSMPASQVASVIKKFIPTQSSN